MANHGRRRRSTRRRGPIGSFSALGVTGWLRAGPSARSFPPGVAVKPAQLPRRAGAARGTARASHELRTRGRLAAIREAAGAERGPAGRSGQGKGGGPGAIPPAARPRAPGTRAPFVPSATPTWRPSAASPPQPISVSGRARRSGSWRRREPMGGRRGRGRGDSGGKGVKFLEGAAAAALGRAGPGVGPSPRYGGSSGGG